MNKQLVKILIVAISIVLCGLIGVQLFWINNAVKLKNEEFGRNVSDALTSVVKKLEEQEALENLRSHEQASYLFFDEDTLYNIKQYAPDSGMEYLIVKDIKNEKGKITIKVTEKSKDKEVDKVISRNVSSTDSLDLDELINMKLALGLQNKNRGIKLSEGRLDSILRNRVIHKTAFVGDIVKRLFQVNLYSKIEDRIHKNQLDSIINSEFKNNGIDGDYSFGIINSEGLIVLSSDSTMNNELLNSRYQIKIFPNDIIQGPDYLKVCFTNQTGTVLLMLWKVLLISAIVTLAIILIFTYSINTIIRQRKLTELRTELINNMTHELKTPISTISLACEALIDNTIKKDKNTFSRYINMIQEENKRLGVMVQNVLQSAVLDKGKFKLKQTELNIHSLIDTVSERISIQLKEKQGLLTKTFKASNPVIYGDPMHLANVLYNILDNANKYCTNQPVINIRTENIDDGIDISISDNGIGIKKEDQARIFERLYRVPTGNVHNVKGFGLGLSYVKIIVEKHGGEISLESNSGEGSTFRIFLSFNNIENEK